MDSGGTLALAILILTLAFVGFYFAFKEVVINGQTVANPSEALQWLKDQFNKANPSASTSDTTGTTNTNILPTPTGQPSTNEQLTGQ